MNTSAHEGTANENSSYSEGNGGGIGFCGRIARSNVFGRFIVGTIVLAGLMAGAETYSQFGNDTAIGKVANGVQDLILWIFVVEAVIKIASYGSRPWRYFASGWNVFDFIIVVVCFWQADNQFAAVLRLARTLRTLRLVTTLPRLQVLVSALLRAIPSLGYVGVLLGLHFYMYAVMGTFLFRDNDPIRFGSLHVSMLTLFEVLTLEGWNDVLNTQLLGSDVNYDDTWKELTKGVRKNEAQPLIAAGYFVTFIMLGTMIMLNLFTGVIIGSMEDAQNESDEATRKKHLKDQGYLTLRDELKLISEQLETIAGQLKVLQENGEEKGKK